MNEYLDQPDASVYQYLNSVRQGVNMPALPILAVDNSKVGMRKRIQNERRVELKAVDNSPVNVMNARPSTKELTATGLNVTSEAAGIAVFYKPVVI
ncbi:hypothetical protein EZ428_15100 [Pedobacter frigiditerrae]|uniref:RagB/SusD domain-containing protein n=1 Tax=Pedobacter frigiditerrae TaxID=2530452 RepID=A0A4R0MU16_9SPHI|nr:hypothetical protein [Pedobacter frigiditerrae]TCC90591.1 hypothetical protein EZ428_15100 [Pedobacter frigiditerrae]